MPFSLLRMDAWRGHQQQQQQQQQQATSVSQQCRDDNMYGGVPGVVRAASLP
jgi:hypothetical protein